MNVMIQLPDPIGQRLADRGVDLRRQALEGWAVLGYHKGVLSPFEVQQMLGHESRWETEEFLSQTGASNGYDLSELEADLKTLDRLLPLSEK